MHPKVFHAFDTLCRARGAGGDVLEVGAVASPDSLLTLPALAGARSKIGVNIAGESAYADFSILRANANRLDGFADASFDTVLCNSMLEHDPFFWLSIAEMKRVARPGGLIAIGVPGFVELPAERSVGRVFGGSWMAASTLTLRTHHHPGDYYRFSPQAVRDVFLADLRDVTVETLMLPPRIIGAGIKP